MPPIGHEEQKGAEQGREPAATAHASPRSNQEHHEVAPPEAVALRAHLLSRLGPSPGPREVVEALRQMGAGGKPREVIAWALQGEPLGNHLTAQVMPLLDQHQADGGARSGLEAKEGGAPSAGLKEAPPSAAEATMHYARAAFYKRSGGRRRLVKLWDGPSYDTAGLKDHGKLRNKKWEWNHDDKVRVINLRNPQDPGSGQSMEDAANQWGATEIDYQTFSSQKESTQLGGYDTGRDADEEGEETAKKAEPKPRIDPKDLDIDTVNALPPGVLAPTSTDPTKQPSDAKGDDLDEVGDLVADAVVTGEDVEGSPDGDAINGVDGGQGKKGNKGRKEGSKQGVSEATRIGKQKDRGGGEGKVPVWYGSKTGTGRPGGSKQSMRDLLNLVTRGWFEKHMPGVELPEKVAVAIDMAATLKDAIEIATVFATAMGMGGLLKGIKGAEEGAEAAGAAVSKEAAEEGAEAASKAGSKEAAEESAEAAAKRGGKEATEEGSEEAAEATGKKAKSAEEGDIANQSNKLKGEFGEAKADEYMQQRGYAKRGSSQQPGSGVKGRPQGIDGVYENMNPPPKWVIADAKFETSKFKMTKRSGKQMSKDWVEGNLEQAVGKEMKDKILREGYQRWELRVGADGSVTQKGIPWSLAPVLQPDNGLANA